ncbi:energy-coupling factor transporter transmembrane component T family protein [Corynebacterium mayonis]|uniref:energy-coupling factor transporter transmembrane component T family protein n=1 Tax=Corynebacterium mayonis TaxID=3062461 RepID=UPI0031402BF9
MLHRVPLGVYVPGTTWVHRCLPGVKLCALILMIFAVTVLPNQPWHTGATLGVVIFLYGVARIPARTALSQLAPVLPLFALLAAYLWWQNGAHRAATTMLGLLATLAAANLLTLTTTTAEMLSAVEKNLAPLSRLGLPVTNLSLAIALTIRLIPLMINTVNESLEARKARGANFSLTAFGTPLVIRSIRRAENISQALMARGAGDEDEA